MTIAIVQQWGLPIEEIHRWRWRRFQESYLSVMREHWEEMIGELQRQELAMARALGPTVGVKRLPKLPKWDDVFSNPFEPPVVKENRWTKFEEANAKKKAEQDALYEQWMAQQAANTSKPTK